MKRNCITGTLATIAIAAGLTLLSLPASAQVSLSGGTYSQNFDSLPSTTGAFTWANNVTLPGWYCNITNLTGPAVFGTGGSATNILGATGSTMTGAFYNFGSNGASPATDRAIGAICVNAMAASGTPGMAYGVRFINDTGVALTNFTVSYAGEQWRNNAVNTAQPLIFSYRVDNNPIDNADPSGVSVWTTVPALGFSTPVFSGSAQPLDGNAPQNRSNFTAVTIPGLVIFPGQEIFFRWLDLNDANNDHAIGIDDVIISFETNLTAVPTGPSIQAGPDSVTIGEGSSAQFAVTVSGALPFSYQWYTSNSIFVQPIDGATGASFTTNLVPVSASGEGFFVVVTNFYGSATSSVAILTVTNQVAVITNINYLHSIRDANFVLTDTNTLFQIEGIVTTPANLVQPLPAQSFFMQDSSGGIDVFFRGGFPFPSAGDLVRVTAPLLQFNGLLELAPVNGNPAHKIEILSSGNPLPTPQPFVFPVSPAAIEDSFEGSYVVVSNVFLTLTTANGLMVAGGPLFMTNLSGQTFDVLVPNNALLDPVGNPLPGNPSGPPYTIFATSIKGVISQSQTSGTVFTNGYSLLLTLRSDIELGTPPVLVDPIPLNIEVSGTDVVLSWTNSAFSLQSSTNLTDFVTIPGSVSPHVIPITDSEMFFRLIYVP